MLFSRVRKSLSGNPVFSPDIVFVIWLCAAVIYIDDAWYTVLEVEERPLSSSSSA